VKISLISATSIFALLSAAIGPSHAAVLSTTPDSQNIYDLVHDGVTSSDGGDHTVTRQDLPVSAVFALEASIDGLQTVGFAGRTNLAAGRAYPITPLGAAPGAKLSEELASATGTGQFDAVQKAQAIGRERVAALIGTVGNGRAANDKAGGTVFVAEGSRFMFNGGGDTVGGQAALVFAPSSTSTATITVAGAGNFPRTGGGAYTVAANSLQVTPVTGGDAAKEAVMSDAAQPTLGYYFAPACTTVAKAGVAVASFSNTVTATGDLAMVVPPIAATRIQFSQAQPVSGRADRLLTSEIQKQQFLAAATPGVQVSESTATFLDPGVDGPVAGTRTLISTSVSANPSAAAATYLATVIRGVPDGSPAPSIEAFQIGPQTGPNNQKVASTTVPEPLKGKIMASAGPLNSVLALP